MMSAGNINTSIKKKQVLLACLIGGAILATVGGIWYVNEVTKPAEEQPVFEEEETELEPNLTGAVGNTFDGNVGSQVVTDIQRENKESREAMSEILEKLKSIEETLASKDQEIEELNKRLAENERIQSDVLGKMGGDNHSKQTAQNNVTGSGDMKDARCDDPNYSWNADDYTSVCINGQTIANTRVRYEPSNNPIRSVSKNEGSTKSVVTYANPTPVKGSFERKTLTKKQQTSSNSRFYIPSGAFSNAIILEGADASAAVTAKETNVAPMQFKLTGDLHLPANKRISKLKGCFVTAGTFGDISSERAIVRLERLSCVIGGKHIDQKVKGHVAFYGKNGIKGVPVMRNGKILGLAFGAGALGGLGGAVGQIGNTQVGMGAERTIGAGEVFRQAAGSGAQTAANKLADYYIQQAEQYHPVIPIGSANRVEVIFQEGFWAEFIEDLALAEQAQQGMEEPTQPAQQGRQDNAIPADLQRQLGEVSNQNLSDFVTPSKQ